MPVSKKDIARVLAGEKRVRSWKEYIQNNPANNPVDKDGNLKQIRGRSIVRNDGVKEPETIDREKAIRSGGITPDVTIRSEAIRSGGITPDVTIRSADSKFAKHHREYSGEIWQGKEQISLIDGHVYGSRQRVGRGLEEARHDEGYDHPSRVIGGNGRTYTPKPCGETRTNSPFKRRWKESTFVVEIKKG